MLGGMASSVSAPTSRTKSSVAHLRDHCGLSERFHASASFFALARLGLFLMLPLPPSSDAGTRQRCAES